MCSNCAHDSVGTRSFDVGFGSDDWLCFFGVVGSGRKQVASKRREERRAEVQSQYENWREGKGAVED